MKKILSFVLVIGLIFGMTGFQSDQSFAATYPKISIDLDVHGGHVSDDHISRGHSLNVVARLYDANGKLVTGTTAAAMKWTVEHDGAGTCQAFVGDGKVSDHHDGNGAIAHGYVHVPYTEHAPHVTLTVESTNPAYAGLKATQRYTITNSKYDHHHTFFYYVKGHHDAKGKAPKVKETWDLATQSYSMTVPKNTFKRAGYQLKYWKDDYGKKFKPGDKITQSRKKHGKLTAVWTKKTSKKISVVKASAKSSTSIKLTWRKTAGATGYNIYRYDADKKKYAKVKKIKKGNTTTWKNTGLEKGTTYKFKVQAIKKGKAQGKSYWVSATTNSPDNGNTQKITLNKKKVSLKVGKKSQLKATLKVNPEKEAVSNNVRWYTTNKKIATVSKNGKITAKSKGKCLVYAKAHNGKNSRKVKVTVK